MKFKSIFIHLPALCILLTAFFLAICTYAYAQDFLYGDGLPDAPELSVRGEHVVGVHTLNLVNKNQIDLLNSK
jgi:hypothetical protein